MKALWAVYSYASVVSVADFDERSALIAARAIVARRVMSIGCPMDWVEQRFLRVSL